MSGSPVLDPRPVADRATDFRSHALDWYRRNRARTTELFDLLAPEAYYAQPIAQRHPVVFYEGHLPAFAVNVFIKKALGRPGIDAALERLFARGIDPDDAQPGHTRQTSWPDRSEVRAFVEAADRLIVDALESADLDVPGHPLLHRSQAVHTILEHEAMHQETMLYMWQQLPYELKRAPAGYRPTVAGAARPNQSIRVPSGRVRVGADRDAIPFGWDNEFESVDLAVPAFDIDRRNVTNAEFLEFVDAGGYRQPEWWAPDDWLWVAAEGRAHPAFWESDGSRWWWRGMFERVELPAAWPVYVSLAEARAYAAWRGRRLPTEAEYQRAAYGSPDGAPRPHPWGGATPTAAHGTFDFATWDPEPVDTHPAGASAWGVDDLVGNGWEWTATPFAPLPGFRASPSYPEYSADFFDSAHFVMKGASSATARELLRPTFRNWFRPRYPYVYATFRCAETA